MLSVISQQLGTLDALAPDWFGTLSPGEQRAGWRAGQLHCLARPLAPPTQARQRPIRKLVPGPPLSFALLRLA